mmetsp:Transcript_27474/g.40585  ORF Transcript_27474/g.40585 Transcript_27474/m.40585 type:complete len:172 (+) Transcript_27474:72-587(+)
MIGLRFELMRCFTILFALNFTLCSAFQSPPPAHLKKTLLHSEKKDEETYTASLMYEIDSDLLPPPITLMRESILFDENASTKANNNILRLWRGLKDTLPFVLTGARTSDTADENPIGGIYNIIFVRIPTILAALLYSKNLIEGHDLILDFGYGPIAISPVIVYGVFFLILR